MHGAPRSLTVVRRSSGPRRRTVRWPFLVAVAMVSAAALVASAPPGSGATVYSSRDAALRREVGRLMADPRVTASTAHVGVVVADASTRVPVHVRYANT